MKTEILQKKLQRYLNGQSSPAETRQIQTWLSCTDAENNLTPAERSELEMDILNEIKQYTAYPLFYPKKQKPWWQRIATMF